METITNNYLVVTTARIWNAKNQIVEHLNGTHIIKINTADGSNEVYAGNDTYKLQH